MFISSEYVYSINKGTHIKSGVVLDEVENKMTRRNVVVLDEVESTMPSGDLVVLDDLKAQMPGDMETTWDMLVDQWKCKECEEDARKILAEECMECEDGIKEENLNMCILGLDVVALFPSLK